MNKEISIPNRRLYSKYGTINKFNPESVYIDFRGWGLRVKLAENYEKVIRLQERRIRLLIFKHLSRQLFHENFICDLNMKSSGIVKNNRAFMFLQIMLYQVKPLPITELQNEMKKLNALITDELCSNEFFNFKKNK